jgi:hypothetical protein
MHAASWIALFASLAVLPLAGVAGETKVPAPSAEQLERWARDLGSDDFQLREEAQKNLAAAGEAAVPALKKAAKSDDPEVRLRAERLLAPLARDDRLLEAAQILGDTEWENVSKAIDVLLERCDAKSQDAVERVAKGTGRTADMAKVLLEEMAKVRMADKEVARMLQLSKIKPSIRKVVERREGEVRRTYRERAYEACLKQFEKMKGAGPRNGQKPE